MSGVEIRVRSDSRQARNDLNKLEQSVKNIETRTAAAGKAFRNLAIGIGAAFSGGVAIKGINNAADSLTNLENRIALVTGRGKDLDKTMNSLFKIAKATRGDIGGSADTYNRFGIALKDAGKSSEELLKAVESVNKAVAISGSSAESAKGALVQLGQGLAAGALRGEELNSVLEAAPRLAQAIADEMEVPLGKIREIAQEGKLTTEVVFNALINQAGALTSEFETMQGTSDQAFNVMKDQISRVVAEISKGLGVTDAFTSRFNKISDSLETNRQAIVSGVVGAFQSVSTLFSGIKTVSTGVISAVAQVVDYLTELLNFENTNIKLFDNKAFSLAEKSLSSIVGFFAAIKLDASIVRNALDNAAEFLSKTFNTVGSLKDDALKSVAKYSKIASDNFKDLYDRAVRFSLLKYVEFRGGSGVIKDYINYLKLLKVQQQVEASASRMFKNTADFATKYLSQAWKSVKTFLNLIERKFYWVYDEVIQNSWWTDTMEQTYFLANKWLGKASDSVGKFGDTVSQKFKGVFESFKKGASAFKANLTISNVKIKFASLKGALEGVGKQLKESATNGLSFAFDSLSSLSPVISASFGAALVAGVTRFLSPELFKKTFGKIGPAAIAVLFAGIATDLTEILKDAGIFTQLGANLGTTLALAFDAVLNSIPVLVDGLIQGVASAGKAFGKALEGSIIGLPAKILSFLPGGGLLTSMLYGSLGLAAINSKFRAALFGMISSAVSRSSGLASGAGMLSSIFYGEKFTSVSSKANALMIQSANISDAAQKKSVQKASANMTAIAGKAKAAHLGIMGVFTAGSVALLGGVLGPELSAIIGLVAGNIASSLLITGTSFATMTARFAGLRATITTGAVGISASVIRSFKLMAVSANTSMASMGTTSKITSASIAANLKTGAAVAGTAFSKLGKVGRLGIIGLAASLLFTSTAFADVGAAGESAASSLAGSGAAITETLLSIGLTAAAVIPLLKNISFGAALAPIGGLITTSILTPLLAGIASITAAFLALPVAISTAIAAIVTVVGGFSIYSLFFGEGDSFSERVKSNFEGLVRSLFALKQQTRSFRKEISQIAASVEGNLKKLNVEIDVVANIKKADLRVLSGNQQESLKSELRNLETLQAQALREDALYGSVSTELLEKIDKSTASIDKKTNKAGIVNINESSSDRLSTSIAQIISGIQKSPSLRGSDIGEEIKEYLRDERTTTETPEGRLAIATQLTGFINQAIGSGAMSANGPEASLLPLFQEVMLRQGDIGLKTLDALDGFRAFTRVTGFTAKTNSLTPDIKSAIQESIQDFAIEQSKSQREGFLKIITEGARAFEITLPDKLNLLAKEDLISLSGTFTKLNTVANDANPSFSGGKNRFIESEALQLGASKDQIDTLNRTVLLAQNAADAMGKMLQTVDAGIGGINERLSNIGIQGLDLTGFTGEISQVSSIAGGIERQMKGIEDTEMSIAALAADISVSDADRLKKNQGLSSVLAQQRQELVKYITYANQVGIADSERLGLLQSAIGSMDKLTFDINKVLGVDAETLTAITTAQNKIGTMTLLLREMNAVGAESVRGVTKEQASEALAKAEKTVKDLLTGTGLGKTSGGGGGKTETAIEKFIGKLSNSDFQADLNSVSEMSKSQMKKIGKSLNIIDAAQKRINKSALSEVELRKKALAAIKEQRAAISESLISGTVGQARSGLEAQGIDSSVLDTNSAAALSLATDIADKQKELDNTLMSELDTRMRISSEIESQQRLLEGITTRASESSDAISSSIKDGLTEVLKGATSVKDALFGVLDTISSKIISTVVDSFVESFFQASGLKGMFDGLFANLFSTGDEIGSNKGGLIKGVLGGGKEDGEGKKRGGGILSFLGGGEEGEGLFSGLGDIFSGFTSSIGPIFEGLSGSLGGIFEGLSGSLGGIFEGLSGALGGLLGGGSSGGGGAGGLLSLGMSFLGFSQGGTVPSTPFSQVGKDSVPAMLMPGEVVMAKNQVANMASGNSKQESVFNINVSGDVSRQTRQEIVKMMPQIAGGVNMQNRENNYKR